jgi:pyochelin synthetase
MSIKQQQFHDGPENNILLHQLCAGQAVKSPSSLAVCSPERSLSYRDLALRVEQVAQRLLTLGLQQKKPIAIVMEKGWEQIVAVLAILKAGAAYLPIDPVEPCKRLLWLLEQGEVCVALTQPIYQKQLPWPDSIQVLEISDDFFFQRDAAPDISAQLSQLTPYDLAYVIFTSGSTGIPKGVMIEHHSAVNTILDINRRFNVTVTDRLLALSALTFDLSVYDIFGPLAAGAKVVMPKANELKNPVHWFELMVQEKITLWNSVPALMQMLVDYIEGYVVLPKNTDVFSNLRLVLLSGDWIPVDLPGRIRKLFKNAKIISLGGATEASIWSILYPIQEVDPLWKSIPYGRPMENQAFYILDEALNPVSSESAGQLYIGGVGVARGYWKDAKRTNDQFIMHPTYGRLYKTGDQGRYLADGNIEFLGRIDEQVKIRGYRVELHAVETCFLEHPWISQAVVTTSQDSYGNKNLVAYVTSDVYKVANESLIRQFKTELQIHLQARLPEYMLPTKILFIDNIPLTVNGKVDRVALASMNYIQSIGDYVLPRTELEQKIASVWSSILGVEGIGIYENFFELGGNSLLASRLALDLEKVFPIKFDIQDILRAATIKNLNEFILQKTMSQARAINSFNVT